MKKNIIKLTFTIINLLLIYVIVGHNIFIYAKSISKNFAEINIEKVVTHKLKKNIKYKFSYVKENNTLYISSKKNIWLYKDKCLNHIKKLDNEIKYIIANNTTILIYTKNQQLITLDAKYYNIRWKKKLKGNLFFKPKISKDKIFIDRNGHTLIAIDIVKGHILWQFFNRIDDMYIFTNGSVIQSDKYIHYIYPNKKILTLKKHNGEKYSTKNISPKTNHINIKKGLTYISNTIFFNGILYLLYNNGHFLSINIKSGKTILENFNKNNINNSLIYKNKLVLIKKSGYLECLSKTTGKKLWKNNIFKNNYFLNPLIMKKSETIFLCDKNGNIIFLNFKTGKLIYQKCILNISVTQYFVDELEKHILLISNDNKIYNIKISYNLCKK